MLASQFDRLYAYNEWAWQQLFPSVARLNHADYVLDRGFYWGSIHGMLVHCLTAEWIWLSRLQGSSPSSFLNPADYADFAAVQARWEPVNAALRAYVAALTDAELDRDVVYHTTSGREYRNRRADVLSHLINHATEHRSQLTPTLFQIGVPTPPLDFILFVRER